jgi:hypothetical protein
MTTKEKVQDYTIAISLPTANVSKEQEISVVNRLRNYFKPTYTYLQSFFSDELVSWLEYNIKNDMSCDLMENYKNMHAAEVKSLKWKITVLKAKLFDEMTRSGLLT